MDRVVASIGTVAITEHDVREEYRIEQFLGTGRAPTGTASASALKTARSRLLDQMLLEDESRAYPVNATAIHSAASKQMADLRAKFKSEREFQSALRAAGVTQQQLMARFEREQRILAVINTRLRPTATVSDKEISDYYEKTFLPQTERLRKEAPPLSAVRGQIREILVQEKINTLLNKWIKRLRTERRVRLYAE